MMMTPTAAMKVLLGLPPLHVMIEAEAQAGIYRLMCTQQWRPKSTSFGYTKKSWDMEHEPILQMGSHRMRPRYAYHKPFTVKFPDKCAWHNSFSPDNTRGLVWYLDRSKTNKGTGAVVYRWGSRRGHNFSLGLHTTVFLAEIYTIKACAMENVETSYIGRNIYVLSERQAAIKDLDSFQTNSKLVVWDCYQSLVKLAEHNSIQPIWVPGHMGIDGNEIADQLAREGSPHPLTGPQPALGISAKGARRVISDCTSRKHEEHWQFIRGQRQVKGFLKKPSARKAAELPNLSRNQLRIMTGLLTGHRNFKGHLFKPGLINSPECQRCKQASETASHVLCDCEALATLRFRHLGHNFMKPDDFEDISVTRILHFVQHAGLLN
jgi:ribonuclease HI